MSREEAYLRGKWKTCVKARNVKRNRYCHLLKLDEKLARNERIGVLYRQVEGINDEPLSDGSFSSIEYYEDKRLKSIVNEIIKFFNGER